jgi:hypothetical protein
MEEETTMTLQRREWLKSVGLGALGAAGMACSAPAKDERSCPTAGEDLLLQDFRPKSMLHVPESRVETPRFPVIDVHTHMSFVAKSEKGVSMGEEVVFSTTPEEALPVMDRKGIRAMLNLTGGIGKGLEKTMAAWDHAHPGRFYSCVEPRLGDFLEPNYPQMQADAIEAAARAGAKGLKIVKSLGLYLREQITEGPLVKVDDRRFDPMWEACGAHDLPVAIHVADPEAFFLPIDCTNELRSRLPQLPGDHGGAGSGLRPSPEDAVPLAPLRARRREPGLRRRVARPVPQHDGGARGPHRRAGASTAHRPSVL